MFFLYHLIMIVVKFIMSFQSLTSFMEIRVYNRIILQSTTDLRILQGCPNPAHAPLSPPPIFCRVPLDTQVGTEWEKTDRDGHTALPGIDP